jgi:outer membrane protein assembly factor BamA
MGSLRIIYIFLFLGLANCLPNFLHAQKVKIDSIIFKGNDRTKASILKRELDFWEGDSLDINQIEQSLEVNRRKLMNTNLFIWTKFDFHFNKTMGIVIQYEFLEQFYTLVFPIFSLADRNLSDWVNRGADPKRIIYGINAIQNNLTGRNEKLGINLETGFTQRYDIAYSNPYIDVKKRFGFYTSLTYQTSNNLAYISRNDSLQFLATSRPVRERFNMVIGFRKRVRFYDFQSLEARYYKVSIADTIFKLNPHYLPNRSSQSEFIQLTYRITYDKRDYAAYPLIGKKMDALINYTGLTGNLNFNYYDFGLSYERYIPLGNHFFFSTTHKLKFTQEGKEIPYFLMMGLGYGPNVVRGYELNVIDGKNFYINRNTLKFQLINKIYKIPFLHYKQINQIPLGIYPTAYLDFGYVDIGQENYFNSKLGGKLLVGYGLGFDLVTYYNLVTRIVFPVINGGTNGFRISVGREF